MIVMGNTGSTGTKGVLLGSNAANVVKYVTVPVLLYINDCRVQSMKKIVFASDVKYVKGYETFQPIRQIAKGTGSKLDILHLDSSKDDPLSIERETLRLDIIFDDLPHGFHSKEQRMVEEDILDYVQEADVDLITVVARNYGFFERTFHRSTSRKMSMLTDVPLLILYEH